MLNDDTPIMAFAEFLGCRVMDIDNRLKGAFALFIALLLIPVGVHPEQTNALLPRLETPGPTENPPPCLSYEPTLVPLTGTIIRRTLPGPPNYKSVAREINRK
jgi:hypothetical protein